MTAASGVDRPSAGDGEVAPDHAALVVRIARHGDRAAFAALFRHYAPRLKTYLSRGGANAAEADELVQEAMLLVWRKAGYYDPGRAAASTWIFTIARNLRIDRIRGQKRAELDPEDPLLVPEEPEQADVTLAGAERAERIRHAVGTLPPDQAEVVRLSFFEDLSHGEVSERLGIPLGTVKSRLRLAFEKVRSQYGAMDQ